MKNNERYIGQGGITVITEIDPAMDIQELYVLLNHIGDNINTTPVIDFASMKGLHFCRWFIIEGLTDVSGRSYPDSLVYAAYYDGSEEDHLKELLDNCMSSIKLIYGYCKDFPGGTAATDSAIIRYFKKRMSKNQLLWPAYRGGTVEQIIGEQRIRDSIQIYLNKRLADNKINGLTPDEIKAGIVHYVQNDPSLKWALTKRADPPFGWKFMYYFKLVTKLLLIVLLLPILLIFFIPIWWLLLSRIFEKKDDKKRKQIVRTKTITDLLNKEDRVFMNQLTIYGCINRPYWYRLTTLKIGLWIFSLNGTYRSNKGKLSGIETIHFANWSLFNKGKNVMFLSNYDGAWQVYLSEFIDRSAMAMNLTFGTTANYPKTKRLLWEGAFDEQAFKTVVRNNQYPSQVFYSTYPYITMKNILNNSRIRKGLDGSSEESVSDWLKRL
jgi:hypothetical protein